MLVAAPTLEVLPSARSVEMLGENMTLILILVLAAAYTVTGCLGLTWAMESGFATVAWPPSGIALAAVLQFGYRVTPGVLIGSFLANLLSEHSLTEAFNSSTETIGTATGIALGASLQAAASCWLIRHFIGYPDPLVAPRRIIALLTLGGPAGCLISAIIGPTVLLATGAISGNAWLETGITWWSGDVLGVLIFTPMLVVWRTGKSMRSASATALLITTFALSIGAYTHIRELDRSRLLLDLGHRAEGIPGALDFAVRSHLSVLGSLEGTRRAMDEVTPRQFRDITQTALTEYNGLHAVSWNRRFTHTERPSVTQWLIRHHGADTLVTERAPTVGMTVAATRPEYVAVLMIEPQESNRPALGFDVLSHPVRRLALNEACDSGQPVATGRITLVQETEEQYGFLVFRPHYRAGLPTATVEDRRRAILGYHTAVYRVGEILARFLTQDVLDRFTIRLLDRSAPNGEQILFAAENALDNVQDESSAEASTADTHPTTDESRSAARWAYNIVVPGRNWELQIDVREAYLHQGLRNTGGGILLAGLIISALVGALTLISTGRQVELEQHIDERTKRLQEEISAREEAESSLLQSQSLSVVGQLTGGIAHDFNNLLGVIVASAELLTPDNEEDHESVDSIVRAVDRGANLTQRLLAFSSRQILRSRAIDPTTLIDGMSGLLNRALGETIVVETRIADDVWFTIADPSQLENCLLNLAINARDAMPNGGRLIFECRNQIIDASYRARVPDACEGDFVAIAATDTGGGMTEKVRQHAFEPFFTTKNVGRGTGLGLSMLYGFIKQSGGHVTISSELEKGTTVTLFLPRTEQVPEQPSTNVLVPAGPGTGQTVLVLEDDEDVRAQVIKLLRKLGYNPVAAADAVTARARFNEQQIDLLLSDVVLAGGVSGPTFAAEVRSKDSRIPIIFMSGYATASAKREIPDDAVLLNKPIKVDALAQALSTALRA
ncbi:MAG: signal transduction histidine kinase/CheY-like chemotaxis protein [Planctomycetota bacterium]|jgi:signal transduction histidine kinase/CheY-like chemotaxis protein